MSKFSSLLIIVLLGCVSLHVNSQNEKGTNPDDRIANESVDKATEWVASLNLGESVKEKKIIQLISTHLTAIRDWHNTHPFSSVPAGINPLNGKPLSELDRQVIADSTIPKSVHETLMNGLRSELTENQVEVILDKYTIGKVAFTMNGYRAIVPDLTAEEESVILANLKEAREMAIDYKNMKEISAIFEIYKTKSEQYLNGNGRNWKSLYKAFVNKVKAEKAAKEKSSN